MQHKEAMFWEPRDGNTVHCRLCHQGCVIPAGRRGFCGVRENVGGRLVTLVYEQPVSQVADPIEKKPLHHFLPGSRAYSLGTRGCNFRCLHCQNCSISQVSADEDFIQGPPVKAETVVMKAARTGCAGMAYTYTEPTIFFEYAFDIAVAAREEGLKNIFVTNGYITSEALRKIAPFLDAANIDLKFFRDDRYRRVCSARLRPVLDMIRLYHELGIWIEITTLVIPGYNDDAEQLEGIARFIAELDPNIPWHVSAFYPTYKLTDAPPTPPGTLERARDMGFHAGLKYVYLGNVPGASHTRCPECQAVLIERTGYRIIGRHMDGNRCPRCGTAIAGVWGA